MTRVNEETSAMLADARMTIQAELESGEAVEGVAFPADRMADFQREWQQRPEMRCLIRAAGKLSEADASKSRTVKALWEMSRSEEWRQQPGGKLPFMEWPF